MKSTIFIAAVALFSVINASALKTKQATRISAERLATIRQDLDVSGCNANVCFAIDGSGSLNATEFQAEKFFVLDTSALLGVDSPAELAAVQFGTRNRRISPLTDDIAAFNIAVEFADQVGGLSFVVGGINYCFSQLFRRRGEANKIVLLGDARSNIGSSAVRRADLFRSIGGDVCVVGAGFTDDAELLAIAGGDPDRVFMVDDFLDTLALEEIIIKIVQDICH